MIPENAHVTLYDGFTFYSEDADMLLGICTAGYFWTDKNRIGIRAPRYLNHELLGLLICKANNAEMEDECEDVACYASPFSAYSGLCERHKKIIDSELSGARIGLDVLILPDSDIQRLKDELGERLEDFREKTGIDAYFDKIKTSKRKIMDNSWLIEKDGIEWILPPSHLEAVYRHNSTKIFLMHKIPYKDRERYEEEIEKYKAKIRERLSQRI